MQTIFKLVVSTFFLMNLAFLALSAREVGGGGYHGPQNYNHGLNRYDNYGGYGGYGGEVWGGGYGGGYGVYPYPPPGSQPGMSDDSNALYNSYLRKHGQGY